MTPCQLGGPVGDSQLSQALQGFLFNRLSQTIAGHRPHAKALVSGSGVSLIPPGSSRRHVPLCWLSSWAAGGEAVPETCTGVLSTFPSPVS